MRRSCSSKGGKKTGKTFVKVFTQENSICERNQIKSNQFHYYVILNSITDIFFLLLTQFHFYASFRFSPFSKCVELQNFLWKRITCMCFAILLLTLASWNMLQSNKFFFSEKENCDGNEQDNPFNGCWQQYCAFTKNAINFLFFNFFFSKTFLIRNCLFNPLYDNSYIINLCLSYKLKWNSFGESCTCVWNAF